MRAFLILGLLSITFISCSKDRLDKDIKDIQEYLDDNGLVAESTDSGLHYIVEIEGTGTAYPNAFSDVTLYYTGYLLDGSLFDSSGGAPVTFNLANVIPGFREGIMLFKKGGKGTIIIPSELAYGNQSVGSIPRNAILVFEIEVVDF